MNCRGRLFNVVVPDCIEKVRLVITKVNSPLIRYNSNKAKI